jgi:hypothetical protein
MQDATDIAEDYRTIGLSANFGGQADRSQSFSRAGHRRGIFRQLSRTTLQTSHDSHNSQSFSSNSESVPNFDHNEEGYRSIRPSSSGLRTEHANKHWG